MFGYVSESEDGIDSHQTEIRPRQDRKEDKIGRDEIMVSPVFHRENDDRVRGFRWLDCCLSQVSR